VPQYLTLDKNFIPCQVDDEDELYRNGIFTFNISKMLNYLKSKNSVIKPNDVTVSSLPSGFSRLKEAHIDSVDLTIPVIIAEIAPNQYNLIDGNHRVEKAKRNNITAITCYQLNVTQHISFLTSKEAYTSYVEYWNGKIE
jgi:hypothetical protein